MPRTLALLLLLVAACPLRADLGPAKAEPNLEKRSRLALENADRQMDAANKAYDSGGWDGVVAALKETRASVDLAIESLKQSGKNPQRGGKYFKSAEIRTRELARKIDSFRQKTSGDEQTPIEELRAHVQRVARRIARCDYEPDQMEVTGMKLLAAAVWLAAAMPLAAQRDFLTAEEIDLVREAQEPNARLKLYIKFAEDRLALLNHMFATEKAGRSARIHETLEDYTKIIEAIDTVSGDALKRNLDLTLGVQAVAGAEKKMLAALQALEEKPAKDRSRYEFALKTALDTTRDSLEMALEDLGARTRGGGRQGGSRPRRARGGPAARRAQREAHRRKERDRRQAEGSHLAPQGRGGSGQALVQCGGNTARYRHHAQNGDWKV